MSETLMSEYYLKCIQNLLEGLDIQNVDTFMEHVTIENCRNMGIAYANAVKMMADKLRGNVKIVFEVESKE
jgi:hypothetical protein